MLFHLTCHSNVSVFLLFPGSLGYLNINANWCVGQKKQGLRLGCGKTSAADYLRVVDNAHSSPDNSGRLCGVRLQVRVSIIYILSAA